jgi:YidC/Oxa1 family membrane protein insertase
MPQVPSPRKPGLAAFLKSWSELRRFNRLNPDQRSIVFYSESGQDWHHFAPIINHLTGALGRTVCYVSSDPADPGLSQKNDRLLPFCITEGFWLISFFQFLKADAMVLTMIDLHCFHLKRSINPVHYIYLFHAMGSTHMVDFANSYDHYDTIFCVGPHQVAEIRRREQLKGFAAKSLFEHGYARVEQLMELAAKSSRAQADVSASPTVLLAPTWGPDSILNVCGEKLVTLLLDAGLHVILRPHYQTLKLTPQVVDAILDKHAANPNLVFVNKMGDTDSLVQSDLLICDWSSMSIEYGLGLSKPVLYIDVPRRVRNPNFAELGLQPLEVTIREQIGAVLSPSKLESAPEVIKELLSDPDRFRERIAALRERIVFNLGRSVEAGAVEIARIAGQCASRRSAA